MLVFRESLIYHSVLNIDSAREMAHTVSTSSGLWQFMACVKKAPMVTERGTNTISFCEHCKAIRNNIPGKA